MTCQWLKWIELISDTMILNIIPLSPKFVTCITSQWVTQTAFHSGAVARRCTVREASEESVWWRHGQRAAAGGSAGTWKWHRLHGARDLPREAAGLRCHCGDFHSKNMGLNKRCGETMVSVSVPPNGSIMWWLSIQRHQKGGEWRLNAQAAKCTMS